MNSDKKVNLAQIVGGIFIAIGIVGAIGWLLTIDTGSNLDSNSFEEDLNIELETDVFDTSKAEKELIKQESQFHNCSFSKYKNVPDFGYCILKNRNHAACWSFNKAPIRSAANLEAL